MPVVGGPPTLWMRFRQVIGRALCETGQALDRVGLRGLQHVDTYSKNWFYVGQIDPPCLFEDHLSRHRQCMPLLERGRPIVSDQISYVAPCSTMIGTVVVGAGSSVWYGAVLKGDACENGSSFQTWIPLEDLQQPWRLDPDRIEKHQHTGEAIGGGVFVGENSNIQDGCILTARVGHTVVGNGVTMGHLAQIHSATVQDHCLIGMGSMILEGSVVETEAFVAAGAVVGRNVTVPSGELWVGNPARKLRDLTSEERTQLHYQANEYVKVAQRQRQVMELGGNLPESLIEHMMLGDGNIYNTEMAEDASAEPQLIQHEQKTAEAEPLAMEIPKEQELTTRKEEELLAMKIPKEQELTRKEEEEYEAEPLKVQGSR